MKILQDFKCKELKKTFKSSVGALHVCDLMLFEYNGQAPKDSHEYQRHEFWTGVQDILIDELISNVAHYDYSLDFKSRELFVGWFVDYLIRYSKDDLSNRVEIKYKASLKEFQKKPSVANARILLKANNIHSDSYCIVFNDSFGKDRVVFNNYKYQLAIVCESLKKEGWKVVFNKK
jgi:hypothetical protein